jgi:hypothetical protein
MSQPNEPKFEDDFFNEPSDDEPADQYYRRETTLEDIAGTKAWNYTLEYDKTTGIVSPVQNAPELKEAYKTGFLEGFTYRLTQPTPDTGEQND